MPKTHFDEAAQEYKGDNLYFISDGEWIKIGRGGSAANRLRSCQTGNPRPLTLIAEIENIGWQEDFWHCCWNRQRGNGEWFKSTPALIAAIAAAVDGDDWTDHVPPLCSFECDLGEWREHMLDALDAYEDEVVICECYNMKPAAAARNAIYDPDFDGRSIMTRFIDAGGGTYGNGPHVGSIHHPDFKGRPHHPDQEAS